MKKKSILSLTLAIVLIAVIGVGATLAYFTDTVESGARIRMGHVSIDLVENKVTPGVDEDGNQTWEQDDTEEGITDEGISFDGVLPGDVVPKNPTIRVGKDSIPVYVRAQLKIEAAEEDGIDEESLKLLEEGLIADIKAAGIWTLTDGYFYYPEVMEPDSKAALFEQVKIPAEWGNDTVGKKFSVKITSQAIQAQGTDSILVKNEAGKVIGWNLGEGEDAIVIESYPAN